MDNVFSDELEYLIWKQSHLLQIATLARHKTLEVYKDEKAMFLALIVISLVPQINNISIWLSFILLFSFSFFFLFWMWCCGAYVYWECWIRIRWYFQLNSPPFPVILRKQFQILGVSVRRLSQYSARKHCLILIMVENSFTTRSSSDELIINFVLSDAT